MINVSTTVLDSNKDKSNIDFLAFKNNISHYVFKTKMTRLCHFQCGSDQINQTNSVTVGLVTASTAFTGLIDNVPTPKFESSPSEDKNYMSYENSCP